MNTRRLEKLLRLFEAMLAAARPRPGNVLVVADLDDAGAVDAAVAQRSAELREAGIGGGLLVVPEVATPEEWETLAAAGALAPPRVAGERAEHGDGRE